MRLTTKIFVLMALVVVSLFAINPGNTAKADGIPAGTDLYELNVQTDFNTDQVVLTGAMVVERQAQTGTSPIECEIIAMSLVGTVGGIPVAVAAGADFGITPSPCIIEEQVQGPTSVLFQLAASLHFVVDVNDDGQPDLGNCQGQPILFTTTLASVPPAPDGSIFSIIATDATTGQGVPLCDSISGVPDGSFGESAFIGGAEGLPPPGPSVVGGIAGLVAVDGTPPGSESSSPINAMTVVVLGAAFVTIAALATGGWYFRRRLIP